MMQAIFIHFRGRTKNMFSANWPVGGFSIHHETVSIQEHSGYPPDEAKNVGRILLPDILVYDPREPVRYPDNGQTLTDDVVDLFFSIYKNATITDKVGPHTDLLGEFPYLGPPHD